MVSVCHSLFVSPVSKTGRVSNKTVSVFVALKWVLTPPVINTVGHNKCAFTYYVIFMHSLHNYTPIELCCPNTIQCDNPKSTRGNGLLFNIYKTDFHRFPLSFQCVATRYCRSYLQKFWNYCTCAMTKKPWYTWRIIVLSNYRIVGQYDNATDRDDGPFEPPYIWHINN